MGCGGADVGEDADVSGDVGWCGRGEDGLGGEGARWWVHCRFPRYQLSILFYKCHVVWVV